MTTRRLAAILAADVVGFSSMMERDEEGTLRLLKSTQRDLIEPRVREHHGRIVKTTGDGFLIEFGSPLDAVRCALEVQEAVSANRGAGVSEEALRFRTRLADDTACPNQKKLLQRGPESAKVARRESYRRYWRRSCFALCNSLLHWLCCFLQWLTRSPLPLHLQPRS